MKKILFFSFASRSVALGVYLLCAGSVQAANGLPDETFNFGQGKLGGTIKHTFPVKNSGTEALTVVSVASSCSCTQIVSYAKKIPAGESGSIVIKTNLDREGDKQVFITAIVEGQAEARTFVIKGEVLGTSSVAATAHTDLWIEPRELIADRKTPVTYLDVRPSALFDQAHVPGSLNLPLFGLTTRSDLKAQNLVLVGSGVDDQALSGTVQACRQAGFTSIHVLRGGVRQWQQAGGRLEGVFWQNPPTAKISSAELLQSADHAPWLVLVPKSSGTALKDAAPIGAKVVAYQEVKSIEAVVASELAANPKIVGAAVFSNLPQDRESLGRDVPHLNRPVFVVEDDWSTFSSLATAQLLARDNTTKTVTSGPLTHSINGCATCP